MYSTGLNTGSQPYYFQNQSVGSIYGLSKSNGKSIVSEGRKGVIYKDSAQFYYGFSGIKVDGQNIGFTEVPDSLELNSADDLNKYLVSQPFILNDNSDFRYNIEYGITDNASAKELLGNDKFINFKLELVEADNQNVIGEYDNVNFTSSELTDYKKTNYKVDTKGIGSKKVVLKLTVNNNFDPGYTLSETYLGSAGNNLSKENYSQIKYNENQIVTTYDLAQNYPNPFNPATVIKYQVPKDGHVTLKVYDILGREVATLIDGFKSQGRYNVTFNAGSLASGVYIYQLRADDFVANKKLILMK